MAGRDARFLCIEHGPVPPAAEARRATAAGGATFGLWEESIGGKGHCHRRNLSIRKIDGLRRKGRRRLVGCFHGAE